MDFKEIIPDKSISLFVKSILVYESIEDEKHKTILPFFADGYPGIMYQETTNGLLVSPHEKEMPVFFLYGQTIKPIELIMEGSYKLIIIQLYPFVLQKFFGLDPKSINDNCYNLLQLEMSEIQNTVSSLKIEPDTTNRIQTISGFLQTVFEEKKQLLDYKIRQSIQLILDNNGQLSISELCTATELNERTLERRFLNEVGISPKQFSRIIQFQQSLEQLTEKDYDKLTDIVYSNGFADQSHFIKVFKAFTGKTPKVFLKN
ncbi:AraC family transcriptional regulator [Flavobacterium amniphilum]|uniref:helix-turn-helix domain-containing protein n=1 Tax=Flavobacterium amniphilum TaxID=1834035 RepID=UPI00202AC1F3|nr:AraC family transcriptional regulator [Flavobacterium amniphilum]MCL9804318.1 AraC family transcriptional regulator [Flavobacterium amniphilum]